MNTPELDLGEVRREVIRYVCRLTDYGKGAIDPEFDDLSLGQIADQVITAVLPHLVEQISTGIAEAIEGQAKEMRDYAKRLGLPWTDSNTAKDAGYGEAANVAHQFAANAHRTAKEAAVVPLPAHSHDN